MLEELPICAIAHYKSNADLIVAAHKLDYIRDTDRVLDLTAGREIFWKKWRPANLVTNDLYKGHPDYRFDFRYPPADIGLFDCVVFDGPYRFNGTPDQGDDDDRYGIEVKMRWQDRMELLLDGVRGAAPLLNPGGRLLVKCQDQVVSGAIRWQTHEIERVATGEFGLVFKDELMMHDKKGGKRQPKGRRQRHARRNYSSLMVFYKKPGRRVKAA